MFVADVGRRCSSPAQRKSAPGYGLDCRGDSDAPQSMEPFVWALFSGLRSRRWQRSKLPKSTARAPFYTRTVPDFGSFVPTAKSCQTSEVYGTSAILHPYGARLRKFCADREILPNFRISTNGVTPRLLCVNPKRESCASSAGAISSAPHAAAKGDCCRHSTARRRNTQANVLCYTAAIHSGLSCFGSLARSLWNAML